MANSIKKLFRGSIATTEGTVYTAPSLTSAVVTNIVVTNPTPAAVNVTVKLDGVEIVPDTRINTKSVFAFDLKQVVETDGTVSAVASEAGVRLHISGMEVTA
jgi:hypothetical protein